MKALILPFLFTIPLLAQELEGDPLLRLNEPTAVEAKVTRLVPSLQAATVGVGLVNTPGSGSAVIISPDGLMMSAAHVTGTPGTALTILLADGREVPGVSLGHDPTTDASMAKITVPGPFPYRPVASAVTYRKGDIVIGTGHPGSPYSGRPPVVRVGRILRAGVLGGFSDPISTSCTVISGDSGGPLFNLRGEVIGIHSNINPSSWNSNNHVPIAVFLAEWDRFVDGETLSDGTGGDQAESFESYAYLEDPFAEVREKFLELLPEHAEAEGLTYLLKRPQLLPLHRMQAYLDRWAPEEDAEKEPTLGFTLASSTGPAIVADVEADSPAASAGLQEGDRILRLAGRSTATATACGLALRSLHSKEPPGSIELGIRRGDQDLDFELTPGSRPARRHFRPPVSEMISQMSLQGMMTAIDIDVRQLEEDYMAPLTRLVERARASVLELRRKGEDARLCFATLVSAEGELLTQASLLPKEGELVVMHANEEFAVDLISKDESSDLALLRFSGDMPKGLTAVAWSERTPVPGDLVYSPTGNGMTMECAAITRPPATIVAPGKEALHRYGATPPYLGLQLEEQAVIVIGVTPDSPADRAGILEGDRITKANGAPVGKPADLLDVIKASVPGDKLRLTLERDREDFQVSPILDKQPAAKSGFSSDAARVDKMLSSLSTTGGTISKRRSPFPACHYHHLPIVASETGSAIFDSSGEAYGINICRSLRHRTLALTVPSVQSALTRLRREREQEPNE